MSRVSKAIRSNPAKRRGNSHFYERPAGGVFDQLGRHITVSKLAPDQLSAACRKGEHFRCTSLRCQCGWCHVKAR